MALQSNESGFNPGTSVEGVENQVSILKQKTLRFVDKMKVE